MSAIWGAIDFSGNVISDEVKGVLRNAFNECAIDKISEISSKNVYMSCGLQFFTPESRFEKLPIETDDVFYTADAVLDNRDEICKKIGIANTPELGDAEIIRVCFEKFDKDCLNELLGAYVFVKYDRKTDKVDIVADAVGNRYIQYFCENNILYFSSLRAPLERLKKELKLNRKWIAYYFGINSLDIFCDGESTIIDGIYRIAPASHIVIKNGQIQQKNQYWDVSKIKRTRNHKSDEDYRREFVDLYSKCVGDTLRTDEEVAIFLSGGYDSTSVACLAAPMLKERGKNLYSFTSVPDEDFLFEGPETEEANEFERVKKNMAFLGNVECDAISLKGTNLWDIRGEYNKVAELPYKSPENMIWLYEGYKRAREKGARLILSGAFGNGTVSYGNLIQYFIWLIKHFKFIKYFEEINAFNRRMGSSRKRMIKATLEAVFRSIFHGRIPVDVYKTCYAYENFLQKNGAIDAVENDVRTLKKSYYDAEKHHDTFLPMINFRHYGEFAFKNSLHTGVLFRDPTRDKRIIEFVKTIPYNQFTGNGYRRRLVREYLEDIMPPKFFFRHPFGVQSADMKFRFEKAGAALLEEWQRIVSKADGMGIVDTKRLLNDIRHKDAKEFEYVEIMRLFYTINALEYMNKYK